MFFMRIKGIKSKKSIKRQTSDFLPLRCSYVHKNAAFLFHTQKSIESTKSIKIIKTQISEQATFLTLDVFYAHKNAAFFVFVRLYAFCAFLCVKSSCKKKKINKEV